jgi:putative membrane-bound dehydrogenase-like protein
MKFPATHCASLCISSIVATIAIAQDSGTTTLPVLKVAEGFAIELVAGPPLVERPITAAFDDEGRLYVAESSGSNDPVEKQLEQLPHRIVRLEDIDGDGKYDRRTVFADRMMFPEGTMFLDGSLYVSAPPSIWQLTDTNGDGVADERAEWFQGKTLTGCANDLHGPYLGPDGWVYWCKGAFAEQTHVVNGREWKSRAAHIFRCRPDGSGLEPLMTGGMDNPVDVVFTPEGERIFSATYFVGGSGRRDGFAHAIYGGVYGKDHGVLEGHARTGELMPMLVPMSAVAPCGLERYDSPTFGPEFQGNLFLCQFNLRKVSRHVLRPQGSTFVSEDSDFVTSENVDFHPTDVLMDADGSLLVIDTGGWYKLCCPTSQLWKPDVLGGIYRVRRVAAEPAADPRGRDIPWSNLSAEQLWALLSDSRAAVRQRASRTLVRRRDSQEVRDLVRKLAKKEVRSRSETKAPNAAGTYDARTAELARLWTISQFESDEARRLIRQLLAQDDELLRHAAMHSVSVNRDREAVPQLIEILLRDSPANQRVAAEALGRIGTASAVPHLLTAAGQAKDRILQHSVMYALIELNEPSATRTGLASAEPGTVAAALVALDQMPGSSVEPDQVIPLLSSSDDGLRHTARWLVTQHPEWGDELVDWIRGELAAVSAVDSARSSAARGINELESMLIGFAGNPLVQKLLAGVISDTATSSAARAMAIRVVAAAKLSQPPSEWRSALATVIDDGNSELVPPAVAAARALPPMDSPDVLSRPLLSVVDNPHHSREVRVDALSVATNVLREISDSQFRLLLEALQRDNAVALRSAAADAISRARLSPVQLEQLCQAIESAGPLELNRLLPPYARSTDERLGRKLLASLARAAALSSLRMDLVRETLAGYGPALHQQIDKLESTVNIDAAAQRKRIEELLPHMADGDIRRGHAVYYSAKASCSACHRLGHAGGTSGPELTRIGETRTERDLLESILFPSLSFVRSYEPVLVITMDGRAINGAIQDETARELVLTTGPDQEVRLAHDKIEEIQPSTVSVMPTGLDSQLTTQEIADLVAFLKNAKGN